MTKENARIDLWHKEVALSDDLRKWFHHDPEKWEEFKSKYENELKTKRDLLHKIKQFDKEKGTRTLLYSSRNEKRNDAVALSGFLKRQK